MVRKLVVKHDFTAFQYADKSLKEERKCVFKAVKKCIKSLGYVDPNLKADRTFILKLVGKNAMAMRYAVEALQKDEESRKCEAMARHFMSGYHSTDIRTSQEEVPVLVPKGPEPSKEPETSEACASAVQANLQCGSQAVGGGQCVIHWSKPGPLTTALGRPHALRSRGKFHRCDRCGKRS